MDRTSAVLSDQTAAGAGVGGALLGPFRTRPKPRKTRPTNDRIIGVLLVGAGLGH